MSAEGSSLVPETWWIFDNSEQLQNDVWLFCNKRSTEMYQALYGLYDQTVWISDNPRSLYRSSSGGWSTILKHNSRASFMCDSMPQFVKASAQHRWYFCVLTGKLCRDEQSKRKRQRKRLHKRSPGRHDRWANYQGPTSFISCTNSNELCWHSSPLDRMVMLASKE